MAARRETAIVEQRSTQSLEFGRETRQHATSPVVVRHQRDGSRVTLRDGALRRRLGFVFRCQRELEQAGGHQRLLRQVIQRQCRNRWQHAVGEFRYAAFQQRANHELGAVTDRCRVGCTGAALGVDVVNPDVLPVVETGRTVKIGAQESVLHGAACSRSATRKRQQ